MRDLGPETPTPQPVTVGHAANRELLAVVGNLLIEARCHTVALESLYTALRDATVAAPRSASHNLLDEYRRHEKATALNLVGLTSLVEA